MRRLQRLASILFICFSIAAPAAAPALSMAEGAGDSSEAATTMSELRFDNGRVSPYLQDDPEDLSAQGQNGGNVQFSIANETDSSICFVVLSPPGDISQSIELLNGNQIPPGESQTFDLAPDIYTVLLRNCANTMIYYRQYLDIAAMPEVHVGEVDVQIARCQARLHQGLNNYHTERFSEAMEAFYLALECFREVPYRMGEGEALNNIGHVHMAYGRYAEAKKFLREALDIAEETGNLYGKVATLNGLATVHMELGQHEEALDAYEEALKIDVGQNPAVEATIRNNLAILYAELGRENDALENYEQLLLFYQEIGNRRQEANIRNNIGHSYRRLESYTKALKNFEQALTIVRESANKDFIIESHALNGMGLVYALEKRYPEALEAFEEALEIDRKLQDRPGEITHLYLIARVLDDLGSQDEALTKYGEAMDMLESVRELTGSDEDRADYISQFTYLYEHALDLYYRQGINQDAFYIAERGRARAFLDLIAVDPNTSQDHPTTNLDDQLLELRQQISAWEDDLESERLKPFTEQNQDLLSELMNELEAARSEYERIFKRQRSSSPDYMSLVSVVPQTIPEMQSQVLDDHTTLIEYFVLEEYILAWVIDQDNFALIRLDISRKDLQDKVEFLYFLVADRDYDVQTATSLYDALFAPLIPYIHRNNLIIVPHNILHYLPFAALRNAESERYLVEDYSLTYAPSASALNFILNRRNDFKGRLLVMGNPDGSLPNAEAEAKAIASLYDARPLIFKEAKESSLYAQADEVDILHLAAHGIYDVNHPLFTRIELTPDKSQDGNLELYEVYGMDLAEANLVVLSACNTALGQMSEGDEVVGLTRAFLFAGTPAIVTTHWAIDDAASGYLMESFYGNLQKGRTNAEALRRAQLAVLAQDRWRQPYYWAAFSLTGDYRGQGDPNLSYVEDKSEGKGICPGSILAAGVLVILGLTGLRNSRKTRGRHDRTQ